MSRPAACALALTAVAIALLSPGLANASPARYVLEKCDPAIPGGGTEGANFHGQPPFAGANNCGEPGGSIFIVQQGEATSSSAFWNLPMPAPPGGSTESITVTGSMCNGAHSDAGTVAFAVQRGWSLNCTTETHRFAVNSPSGVNGQVWLGCEGHCEGDPESWAAVSPQPRSTRWRQASMAWAGRCSKEEFSTVTRRPAPWPRTKAGALPR